MTGGIVNVLKPPGMTSHDVVSRIRHIYGVKKAGHSGTLDPDAAGVLPVFIGKATRLLEYEASGIKQYRAEGILGIRTDTGDDSGNVLETKPVPDISAAELEEALQQFRGKILQVPPMYSALKINGKKLYEYARKGIEIERTARPIDIFHLDCIKLFPPFFCLDIECSKGTYIRTLLEDIAVSLGTFACMTFLLRTKAGDFSIEESHTLNEIAEDPVKVLLPPEYAVRKMEKLCVNVLQAFRITNGVRTTIKGTASGTYSLYLGNVFLGTVTVAEEIVKPEKILVQIRQPQDL